MKNKPRDLNSKSEPLTIEINKIIFIWKLNFSNGLKLVAQYAYMMEFIVFFAIKADMMIVFWEIFQNHDWKTHFL